MEYGLSKKKITQGLVLLIVLALVVFVIGCESSVPEPTVEETERDDMMADTPEVPETIPEVPAGEVSKTFVLTGQNFKFVMDGQDNPDLKVKVGDTVKIEFNPTEGFHDWKVDEFNAATQKVRAGTPTSVVFVADKAGTFEYYCSIGSHRQQGMKGNLIVE